MTAKDPKYLTIFKEIVSKIEAGELQPGDRIPSENDLINIYKVSNTTARKALLEIELQGWGTRIKGKGTFVLNRTEDKHLTRILGSFDAVRESFDENLIKEGFKPRKIILEKTIIENGFSSEINNRHYIIDGPVLKIHLLRFADETLLKDEIRYISMTVCPKINLLEPEQDMIKIYDEKYQLKLQKVIRTLGTTILKPGEINNYFAKEIPLAVFIIDGVILSSGDKVIEIERSFYRGDRYRFTAMADPELNKN